VGGSSLNKQHEVVNTMKKLLMSSAIFVSLTLSAAKPAHAQLSGCPDSPENPTLILAGLASGAFAVSQVKTRLRAKRKTRNQ
jgi:XrtJ-associated TM-motif-TM protein